MKIPFDQLCPTAWLVYADYCAEQNRFKGEVFARKTAISLARLHECKVDPKAVILGKISVRRFTANETEYRTEVRWVPMKPVKNWHKNLLPVEAVRIAYNYGVTTWTRDRELCRDYRKYCPADFPDPWKLQRLSFKFFKMVNKVAKSLNPPKSKTLQET